METGQIIIVTVCSVLFAASWFYTMSFTLNNTEAPKKVGVFTLCSIIMGFMFAMSIMLLIQTTSEINELRKQSKEIEPKYEKVTEVLYRKKI